jgi:hypothetical protein
MSVVRVPEFWRKDGSPVVGAPLDPAAFDLRDVNRTGACDPCFTPKRVSHSKARFSAAGFAGAHVMLKPHKMLRVGRVPSSRLLPFHSRAHDHQAILDDFSNISWMGLMCDI